MSIQQKYTLFNEYLDSIYESGYAEQLATERPWKLQVPAWTV